MYSEAWSQALQRLDCLDHGGEKAFNKLSEEQKAVFRGSTDARSILDFVSKAVSENKSAKRLVRINNAALRPFYQFEKAFSQAVQTNAALLSPIWAPILLVLQKECSINVSEGYKRVDGVLKTILDGLLRIDKYEKLYCSNADTDWSELVKTALVRIYGDIIDFCIVATAHFSRSTVRTLVRGVVTTVDGEFKEVIDNLESHVNDLGWVANLADKMEQKQQVRDELRLKIKERLSPIHVENDYLFYKSALIPGTFQWLLQSPAMVDWFQPSDKLASKSPALEGNLLVVRGHLGCGKSILSTLIIDELRHMGFKNGGVFFFYCRSSYTASACLRSLMAYLLETTDPPNSVLETLSKLTLSAGLSVNALWDAMRQSFYQLLALVPRLFCVIDGLDQCHNESENDQLSLLRILTDIAGTVGNFNVLLTYRMGDLAVSVDIEESLKTIDIHPWDIEIDLKKVTETWVARSSDLQRLDASKIIGALIHGSQGSFLWIKLMMKELKGVNHAQEVTRILQEQPREISEVYRGLVQKRHDSLNANQWNRFVSTVWWLALSPRLVTLQELLEARKMMHGAFSGECEVRDKEETRHLLEDCGSLISFHKDGTVRLIHQSFADYLVRGSETSTDKYGKDSIHRDPSDVHYQISAICLNYLTRDIGHQQWKSVQKNKDKPSLAFLRYASEFWVHHTCLSGPPHLRQELLQKIQTFLTSAYAIEWFEAAKFYGGPSWLGKMLAFQSLLSEWLTSGSNQNSLPENLLNNARNLVLQLARRTALAETGGNTDDEDKDGIEKIFTVGVICLKQGLFVEAEKWLERTKSKVEKQLGRRSKVYAKTLREIADLLDCQARLEEAQKILEEALDIEYQIYMDKKNISMDTLETMIQLGFIYQEQRQYEKAKCQHLIALQMCKEFLGKDSLTTLRVKNHLAVIAREQGDLKRAEHLHEEVRDARRELLGEDHPAYLQVLNHLAIVYWKQNKLEEAGREYRRTLKGRERVLGFDHPTTLNTAYSIGVLSEQLGRKKEARIWYLRVLAGRRKKLGEGHPKTKEVSEKLKALRRQLNFRYALQDIADQYWSGLLAFLVVYWRLFAAWFQSTSQSDSD